MNALHEIQKHVANDLCVARHKYFSGMEEFLYTGSNPKRGGRFEETRYRVPSLDFFDGYLLAGNAGGERPSDYARSVHYHNLILQAEGVKGVACGFDVEPSMGADRRPAAEQPDFCNFMDAVLRHSRSFLLLHVTDPFKTHAYRYASERGIEMTYNARISGVVNPFLFDGNGAVYADNVDGYAMMQAIEEKKPVKGSRILLIGAGGSASSIALEAVTRSCGQLVIANRTPEKAEELRRRLMPSNSRSRILAGGVNMLHEHLGDADILISAITENPYVDENIAKIVPRGALFADVNYGSAAAVAAIGQKTGHNSIDGGPMVYYGVRRAAEMAFEKKLGRKLRESAIAAVKREAPG